MNELPRNAGPTSRSVEIGTALFILVFGLVVVTGSLQAGIGWGAEGPKAGFFPFYVGAIIVIGSAVNVGLVWLNEPRGRVFADWGQLLKVASVAVPTAFYVALIPFIGIYVASMLLIALFMAWLGHYRWPLVAVIALGMPLVTFVIFEMWFLVPLPKGPVEALLGF
jgi:putative tricarboxylic transport membrane protein